MKSVIIGESPSFQLRSFGNGWAYSLQWRDASDFWSVWVQDEDASEFRDRLNAYEAQFPDDPQEQILGRLWREYEDVATHST